MVERREEFTKDMEQEIVGQMDNMLRVYWEMVKAHTTYLHLLNETFPTPVAVQIAVQPKGIMALFVKPSNLERIEWRFPSHAGRSPMVSYEQRKAWVQARVAEIRRGMEKQPAAEKERRSHIVLLEKHLELLERCEASDQRIVAQLEMIPDFFRVIRGRTGAAGFSAREFSGYLGEIVEQVESSSKFAEEIRAEFEAISNGNMTEIRP
jgi:hypothetical protein